MIPKFRFWHKKLKEMSLVDVVEFNSVTGGLIGLGDGISYFYPAVDIILMQSTGLFDKNGKEIFEGDILKSIEGDLISYGFVCFGELQGYRFPFPIRCWLIKSDNQYYALTKLMIMGDEVIGNIYENPELVEELF